MVNKCIDRAVWVEVWVEPVLVVHIVEIVVVVIVETLVVWGLLVRHRKTNQSHVKDRMDLSLVEVEETVEETEEEIVANEKIVQIQVAVVAIVEQSSDKYKHLINCWIKIDNLQTVR